MRKGFSLAIIGLVSLVLALGTLTPLATYAAPASQYFGGSVVGTLVARPQSTLPSTLLLQVNGGTVAVVVSAGTQIENNAGGMISLSSLADGDTLQITGSLDGAGQIDAAVVQDLSQSGIGTPPPPPPPSYSYQVSGTLAAAYYAYANVLCLQSASVISGAITPNIAIYNPCPSGELAVYYTGSTTFENANSAIVGVTTFNVGDSLTATGTLNNGQFTASVVQDLSQQTTPPPPPPPPSYSYQVSGTLAAAYYAYANVLCLQSASVISGAITPNIAIYNPCPSGELAVYYTGSTSFENANSAIVGVTTFNVGDSLTATGTLNNGQFTASVVQDLSQQTTPPPPPPPPSYSYQVSGTLAAAYYAYANVLCLQSASVTNGAFTPNIAVYNPCPSGELAVYYTGSTSFENANGTPIATTALNVGDSLTATGTLNNGQFTATMVQDLSSTAPTIITLAPATVTPAMTEQITNLTIVATIQGCQFSGRTPFITFRVGNGALRGVYRLYLRNTARVLSQRGIRTRFTVLHKGQQIALMGRYNHRTHRWVSALSIRVR